MQFYKVWFAKLVIFYKIRLTNPDFLQYFHTFLLQFTKLEYLFACDIINAFQ